MTIRACKRGLRWSVAIAAMSTLFFTFSSAAAPTLVRHAGGEIRGVRYSNSLEAIHASIALGASLIEIDLVPTREGAWYCLHDYEEIWPADAWRVRLDRMLQRWYAKTAPWAYPGAWSLPQAAELESYLQANDARSGLRHCQLKDLTRISKAQQGRVVFVTDTKYDNLSLLATLARLDKAAFAPQVYNVREYFEAKRLGFPRIIFTMYKHGDYEPLRPILHDKQLWKIVLPADWLCVSAKARPPAWLNEFPGERLVHTVNAPDSLCPSPIRIDGYYTDTLVPATAASSPTHEH